MGDQHLFTPGPSDVGWTWPKLSQANCPDRDKHRPPAGPNEDVAQCGRCGALTYEMRPWGETFGTHADDCSLPIWHEGYCEPGGAGHPEAPVIRGYWPEVSR